MLKNFLLLLLVVYAFNSFAQTDYSAQVAHRVYPLGLALEADFGYGQELWRHNKQIYGYIRPSLKIKTSGVVNYGYAQLDVFPVSFLGLYYGKAKGMRSLDKLQGFDCDIVSCDSNVDKNYYGLNLALAYKEFKFINLYKVEELDYDIKTTALAAEELSNLIVKQEDDLKSNTTVLAYEINSDYLAGLIHILYQSDKTDQESKMMMPFVQKKWGEYSLTGAMGTFKSRDESNHFSGLISLKWSGKKGLRLF